MKSIRRDHALAGFMLLICAVLGSSAALAQVFEVTVDTSALAGTTGYVDFQLNPADVSAPQAGASILDWAGNITLLGAPMVEGNVTGTLPGTLQLANSTAFNDYFHAVEFGDAIRFVVEFTGNSPFPVASVGTSFALALYDADAVSPLLSDDISGSLVRFELALGELSYETFSPVAQVSAVPLPAAAWLLLTGLTGLIGVSRRRLHA
ncbi:MAG: NF038129 family PEP-CTERM protein [Pseudomonadota bacterium]|nr:NF038129 family PEP-CTERM protein [Pseudomonadota bacterium]